LLLIGDSIPNQMISNLADKYFEGDLGQKWAEKFNGGFRNRCISGVTSLGLDEMLEKVTLPQAETVCFWFGINDLSMNRPVSEVELNYNKILSKVRRGQPSARFVVVSVLPVCNSPDNNAAVLALNSFLKSTAGANGFRYEDVTPAVTDAQGKRDHNSTYDGVHPTAESFTRIEKIIADAL
jgi:lysophospholipase L1-like esterase